MKWFRRLYILDLISKVEKKGGRYDEDIFLCLQYSIYSLFICWKELKEVQDNLDSEHIYSDIRCYELFNCDNVWFHSNRQRIAFLKECLNS